MMFRRRGRSSAPTAVAVALAMLATIVAASAHAQMPIPGLPSGSAGQTPAAEPPPAPPAAAPAPAAAAVDEDQVRALLQRLENPEQRAAMIGELRALLAVGAVPGPAAPEGQGTASSAAPAESGTAPTQTQAETTQGSASETGEGGTANEILANEAVAWVQEQIDQRGRTVGQVVDASMEALATVPELGGWITTSVADASLRDRVMETNWYLLIILGPPLVVFWLVRRMLRPARDRVRVRVADNFGTKLILASLELFLLLLPIAAFVASFAMSLALAAPPPVGRIIGTQFMQAIVLVGGIYAVSLALFAPRAPGIRLLPIQDSTAIVLNRIVRRLVTTAVFGLAIIDSARWFGLPWTLQGALQQILALVLAGLAAGAVIRYRTPVARSLTAMGDRAAARGGAFQVPWGRIAGLWHFLALAYIAVLFIVWTLRIPGGFTFLTTATIWSLAIMALSILVLTMIDRAIAKGQTPIEQEVLDRDLDIDDVGAVTTTVEAKSHKMMLSVARLAVLLLSVGAILQAWGVNLVGFMLTGEGREAGESFMVALVIIVVAYVVWRSVNRMITRYLTDLDAANAALRATNRNRTLLVLGRNAVFVLICLIGTLLVLSQLGVNIAPLLAGAGVFGLAIGFGAQTLVKDIITGVFILIEDILAVGDIVNLGGKGGVVEAVSIRTVRLRDYDGSVHTIPFSTIDAVTNLTKEFSMAVFNVGVAYGEDVDHVIATIEDLAEKMRRERQYRRLILEPLEMAGLDSFGESALMIKCRFKVKPAAQWTVMREFNKRLKRRFDELGISIPFPHRTVVFEPGKGDLQPLPLGQPAAGPGLAQPIERAGE
ncbi:mechanosensitive ion channel family protein [Marinivivus vitaminiproducens]|uniref:mechanosensitive ion channel family protein n=1 Tax=Marinivivus vitaminiproducens TaxID=3035935 RepID=UPI0027AAB743|nr:mechanosensitive ion channel [Geminicoccaceae bacterium SCSIO 64248]